VTERQRTLLEALAEVTTLADFPVTFAMPLSYREHERVLLTAWLDGHSYYSTEVSTELLKDSPASVVTIVSRHIKKHRTS
jgi:hypothetical protein